MLKQLHLLGVSWVALVFTLACNKEPDSAPVTNPNTSSAGSTALGGSANSPEGSGGADDEAPARKGERGSSCNADNDCGDDLSCIVTRDCPAGVSCANKSCQPSNFGLMGTGKRCFLHECTGKADCCGDLPQAAPEKCDKRTSICNTPNVAGCTVKLCTADLDCGPGTCAPAVCSVGGAACNTTADCVANTCDPQTMQCTVSQTDCSVTTCLTSLCPAHYCNCKNPDYLPTSPICTDPDCDGICGFTCTDERCVVDKRCGGDAECGATTPYCSDGACVACRTSDDCEEEECLAGRCGPQCESDTQCKLFEACDSGSCVFVGCRSDRECVLKAGAADLSQVKGIGPVLAQVIYDHLHPGA